MTSFLASFAAGYDVRMANVVPVHPRIQPPSLDIAGLEPAISNSLNDEPQVYHNPFYRSIYLREKESQEGTRTNQLYGNETYHGNVKRTR